MSSIAAGTTLSTGLVSTGDTSGELVLKTNGSTTAVTIGANQIVTLAQPLPINSGGTGATSLSGITVGTATNATNATNIAGGGAGQVPYNSGASTTNFLAAGSSGQVLTSNGTSAPSWGSVNVANGGTGQTSLTANNVILGNGTSAVQFVAPGTAGNILTSNGTTWTSASGIASPLSVTGNSTAGAEIRLPEDTDNGSNYVALKAADSIASNVTFTLPAADGTNGQVLQTNGSGTLSFSTISAGGLTLIQTVSLGNSTATINLPANWNTTYKYLVLLIDGDYKSPSGSANYGLRFNGDTGNNYSYNWVAASGSGTTSGFINSSTNCLFFMSSQNNYNFSASLQIRYNANVSTYSAYKLTVQGFHTILNSVYSGGGSFSCTTPPSSLTFPLPYGSGYYLLGSASLYGAS